MSTRVGAQRARNDRGTRSIPHASGNGKRNEIDAGHIITIMKKIERKIRKKESVQTNHRREGVILIVFVCHTRHIVLLFFFSRREFDCLLPRSSRFAIFVVIVIVTIISFWMYAWYRRVFFWFCSLRGAVVFSWIVGIKKTTDTNIQFSSYCYCRLIAGALCSVHTLSVAV